MEENEEKGIRPTRKVLIVEGTDSRHMLPYFNQKEHPELILLDVVKHMNHKEFSDFIGPVRLKEIHAKARDLDYNGVFNQWMFSENMSKKAIIKKLGINSYPLLKSEYDLIQAKQSKLSSNDRKVVVKVYEKLYHK